MELETNIVNAFKIVEQCHKSADLLIKALQQDTSRRNTYKLYKNGFLRWNSDNDYKSWCYSSFILLYQKSGRSMDKNALPSLYSVQIDFSSYEAPKLIVTKMFYSALPENISKSHHDKFYFPAYLYSQSFEFSRLDNGVIISHPKSDRISESYWGLKKAFILSLELVEITADNYKKKIFGAMEELDKL